MTCHFRAEETTCLCSFDQSHFTCAWSWDAPYNTLRQRQRPSSLLTMSHNMLKEEEEGKEEEMHFHQSVFVASFCSLDVSAADSAWNSFLMRTVF